jgi:hypothetical protein
MLLVNSGMPTGQAVQRRLQPLTTSTQYSMGFAFGTGAGDSMFRSLRSFCFTGAGTACFKGVGITIDGRLSVLEEL